MAKATAKTYGNTELTSLPTGERHPAAMRKYAEAVRMYSETCAPLVEIAGRCGVTPGGLGNHIGRYHRDLLMKRYGMAVLDCSVPLKRGRGQSLHIRKKYRSAIRACSDMAFIELNISQIARIFGHDGTSLANQLRFHYPEVIPERERVRRELGIADNIHRGVRSWCEEAYAGAVVLYRDTDMTVREAAESCGVSPGGLGHHLQFYNKEVVGQKASRRDSGAGKTGSDRAGTLSGNGRKYGPTAESVERYAGALELYRTTTMPLREIASASGVPYAGLRSYLRLWHSGERRPRTDETAAATKYAPAITSLEDHPRHISAVASEYGLNAEVFREYLRRHRPDLAEAQGMSRGAGGRLTRRSSAEKYAKAIEEYSASGEPLKSIASRHGLAYSSLSAYVRRNCPSETESHRRNLRATDSQPQKQCDTNP